MWRSSLEMSRDIAVSDDFTEWAQPLDTMTSIISSFYPNFSQSDPLTKPKQESEARESWCLLKGQLSFSSFSPFSSIWVKSMCFSHVRAGFMLKQTPRFMLFLFVCVWALNFVLFLTFFDLLILCFNIFLVSSWWIIFFEETEFLCVALTVLNSLFEDQAGLEHTKSHLALPIPPSGSGFRKREFNIRFIER